MGSVLSLKGQALRYLARREHSRAELERKLARHVEDRDDASATSQIAAALDELTARGLLSEQRAAEGLVAARAGRFGPLKLRQQLRARGVEPAQAEAALASISGDEAERARAVWQRKYGTVAADARERARQARFLMGRGFSPDTVRRLLRDASDDESIGEGEGL